MAGMAAVSLACARDAVSVALLRKNADAAALVVVYGWHVLTLKVQVAARRARAVRLPLRAVLLVVARRMRRLLATGQW